MWIVYENGKLVRDPYLYSMLRREDTDYALFIQHMKFYNEIVSFQVGELKEYRSNKKTTK